AAHFAFDQCRASEQAQPQPQLRLVVCRALRDLGLGIERDGACVFHQISPPATVSVVPVIALASGEHRNRTAAATSSGVISRSMGLFTSMSATACSSVRPVLRVTKSIAAPTRSVSVYPGHTALTVTPLFTVSCASARAKPTTACFAMQ